MNWYKISKSEKKPYNIYVFCPNEKEKIPEQLKDKKIDAYTAEQARFKFLEEYKWLRDYLMAGCEVEAKMNVEEYNRRKKCKQMESDRKEKLIQDAWWNK